MPSLPTPHTDCAIWSSQKEVKGFHGLGVHVKKSRGLRYYFNQLFLPLLMGFQSEFSFKRQTLNEAATTTHHCSAQKYYDTLVPDGELYQQHSPLRFHSGSINARERGSRRFYRNWLPSSIPAMHTNRAPYT